MLNIKILTEQFFFGNIGIRIQGFITIIFQLFIQFITNQLKVADLILDRDTKVVTRAGKEISLSSKEFMVLECLMRNQNIVMTRQQIEQNAWNYDFEGGSNVIDVYIRYLRKKIDAGYDKKLIHTVRGTGYVMRKE